MYVVLNDCNGSVVGLFIPIISFAILCGSGGEVYDYWVRSIATNIKVGTDVTWACYVKLVELVGIHYVYSVKVSVLI